MGAGEGWGDGEGGDVEVDEETKEIARLIQRGYASPNAMELKPPSFHRALHLAATRGHTDMSKTCWNAARLFLY